MKLSKIGFEVPMGENILLYWEKTKHYQDGILYFADENNTISHILFDGEMLNDEPSHWCYLPEIGE